MTNHLTLSMDILNTPHIPVNAFFPPVEEPAGITLRTLNRTVFDNGLKIDKQNKSQKIHMRRKKRASLRAKLNQARNH